MPPESKARVTLQKDIQVVIGSHLGLVTGCLDKNVMAFLSCLFELMANCKLATTQVSQMFIIQSSSI
jgi:hypothetical protein